MIFFIPNVSPVRAEGTTESAGSAGSASSISTGAGSIEGAAGAAAEILGVGLGAREATEESEPGRAGTEPANAGPGVIGTRAGAVVICAGSSAAAPAGSAGPSVAGSPASGSTPASIGSAASGAIADVDGVAVSAK